MVFSPCFAPVAQNVMQPMSEDRTVPREADWGDYKSHLDRDYAHQQFTGNFSPAQPCFQAYPTALPR